MQQPKAGPVSALDTEPPRLEVIDVRKVFTDAARQVTALDGVSLSVADGELLAIVGPSGCGKSTLLNLIASLDQPTTGEIRLDGVPASDRLGRVAYMPQRDLLLPWRTTLDNVTLALEIAGVSRAEARRRADTLLDRFGLRGFEESYPAVLSGGMRQRAAFLRAVLPDTPLLLLDEPFGALDALTRAAMQAWLLDLWADLRRTVVLVTHDVDEAILLSDRVAVLSPRPGRLVHMRAVDLPRPRHYDLVTTPAFTALKADLLDCLRATSGLS